MIIGFTGTRQGCTIPQARTLAAVLFELKRDHQTMTNGACEGADRQAAEMWLQLGGGVNFRPGDAKQHAWAMEQKGLVTVSPTEPYLERNKIIANRDVLVATPKEEVEILRSGTWATIRYARRMSRPRYIILPNGSLITSEERN